ncbi:MAG: DUF2514 domain-containing protein [Castellaniella sp.]|nr:DUF2514 domain-containing protein [Castellaniella sp.]
MIAAALKALAGWRGYAAAAVAAGMLAAGAAWTVQGWRYDAKISGMERDQAQQIADAQALARATEQARWSKREEIINDAKTQAAAAAADAAAATADLERVRAEVKRLRGGPRDPAASGRGPGIESADPIGLLADMYERGAADAVARSGYADALKRAGLMCERLYDSL